MNQSTKDAVLVGISAIKKSIDELNASIQVYTEIVSENQEQISKLAAEKDKLIKKINEMNKDIDEKEFVDAKKVTSTIHNRP